MWAFFDKLELVQDTNILNIKKRNFIMTLTKSHVINAISDQVGFPKNHSSEILETLLEIIKKSLESGDDVMISNFGKFCVREKEERRGRNPTTNETMMLKPRRVVTFRCSGKLRERINGLPG